MTPRDDWFGILLCFGPGILIAPALIWWWMP